MQPHTFLPTILALIRIQGQILCSKQGFGAPMELPTPVLLATGQGPWSTTLGECRYHEERKPRIFRFSERQTEGLKPSPTLQASKWVRLKIDQHGKNLLKRAISCDQDPSDFGEFPEILARSR